MRPWSAMFVVLAVGIGLLAIAAVTGSTAVAIVSLILIAGAMLAGAYFGEKSAGQIQRDPTFGRRKGGRGP